MTTCIFKKSTCQDNICRHDDIIFLLSRLGKIQFPSLFTFGMSTYWYARRNNVQGADPGFSLGGGGGGGRKRLCARTNIMSAEPNSLSAGVQGPLKGPGSSRVVLVLSRAI